MCGPATGHTADVLDLAWSKSQFLLTASMDKTVRLWHISMDDCLRVFKCAARTPLDLLRLMHPCPRHLHGSHYIGFSAWLCSHMRMQGMLGSAGHGRKRRACLRTALACASFTSARTAMNVWLWRMKFAGTPTL